MRSKDLVKKHTGSKVPKVLRDMVRCYRKQYSMSVWQRDRWAKERPDELAKSNRLVELLNEYNFDVKKLCEDFANVKS